MAVTKNLKNKTSSTLKPGSAQQHLVVQHRSPCDLWMTFMRHEISTSSDLGIPSSTRGSSHVRWQGINTSRGLPYYSWWSHNLYSFTVRHVKMQQKTLQTPDSIFIRIRSLLLQFKFVQGACVKPPWTTSMCESYMHVAMWVSICVSQKKLSALVVPTCTHIQRWHGKCIHFYSILPCLVVEDQKHWCYAEALKRGQQGINLSSWVHALKLWAMLTHVGAG